MSTQLDLDAELGEIIGVGNFQYKRAMAISGPMPMAMFNNYVDIIDRSRVPQQLESWAALERKKASGRKALLTFRAVLVVELISAVWSKGAQYAEFADTLAHRLSPAQFEVLGIKWDDVDEEEMAAPALAGEEAPHHPRRPLLPHPEAPTANPRRAGHR